LGFCGLNLIISKYFSFELLSIVYPWCYKVQRKIRLPYLPRCSGLSLLQMEIIETKALWAIGFIINIISMLIKSTSKNKALVI
jgi:hypothetical protein